MDCGVPFYKTTVRSGISFLSLGMIDDGTMEIVIGNKNYSSWSLRAWLVAKSSGLAFTERVIFLDLPTTAREIAAVSPSSRVPVLRDGASIVWDSLAIAEYLAERAPHLWPSDPVARAHARCIVCEMHSGFVDMRSHMTMNLARPPQALPAGLAAADAIMQDVARVKAMLEDTLARFSGDGPYLFGHGFGIADAFFAPVMTRFRTYAVPVEGALAQYQAAIFEAPFMKEWAQASLGETPKMMRYETAASV